MERLGEGHITKSHTPEFGLTPGGPIAAWPAYQSRPGGWIPDRDLVSGPRQFGLSSRQRTAAETLEERSIVARFTLESK